MFRLVCVAIAISGPASGALQEGPRVKLSGYVEYHQNAMLVVEGQRVAVNGKTKFKGKSSLAQIPLGYEAKVEGHRQADGTVLAKKIEVKPNGQAMYESDVLEATNQIEKLWVDAGEMYMGNGRRRQTVGDIKTEGPEVERGRRIMLALLPPYVSPNDVRVHVVETKEWNASAMGNGAVWVYTGLLNDMDDDEIAIILAHELAHYTHEHSRRGMKKSMWGQLVGLAGAIGAGAIKSDAASSLAGLGLSAWQSGYSRDLEDQADRVGLRYAYEAGFDVSKGPGLWEKFRKKYGEADTMSTFLFGSHSRPTDRIRNIRRELRVNYRDTLDERRLGKSPNGHEMVTPNRSEARVIAIANCKGGVGKTTTTVSLGAALAERGHRVLLVDLDSQQNLSSSLGAIIPNPGLTDVEYKEPRILNGTCQDQQ